MYGGPTEKPGRRWKTSTTATDAGTVGKGYIRITRDPPLLNVILLVHLTWLPGVHGFPELRYEYTHKDESQHLEGETRENRDLEFKVQCRKKMMVLTANQVSHIWWKMPITCIAHTLLFQFIPLYIYWYTMQAEVLWVTRAWRSTTFLCVFP